MTIDLLKPAFGEDGISIVFSVDESYVPYLGVSLYSLMTHRDTNKLYDIIIIHNNLSKKSCQRLLSDFQNYQGVSIRFLNISTKISSLKHLFYTPLHFSDSPYYRLLLPEILSSFNKIIYLDSDLIFLSDISELWNVNVQNYLLAATRAIGAINSYFQYPSQRDYWDNKLKMVNPTYYIQAGVCVFNLEEMRRQNTINSFLETLKRIQFPPLVDQDILSSVCQTATLFLPQEWNYNWHLYNLESHKCFPRDLLKDFKFSQTHPKIFHYSSPVKPWDSPQQIGSEHFWFFARETSFYEEIIYKRIDQEIKKQSDKLWKKQKEIANHHKILWQYYKYKILSKITIGKTRSTIKQKRDILHNQVRKIREELKC